MYFTIRRGIDTCIAFIALIVLSPLFLLLSIAIKCDSKGPVFFKQERIGKDFKSYQMIKFRSMVVNAQNIGTGVYSFANDPRVTKVGRFLRKTSLDELPQLWNIIKGDMSFVGPRSPVVGHFPAKESLNEDYKRRFTVLPGITGLAQVTGRNEMTWDEKVRYDNLYIDKVKRYTIFYDIQIWFLTIARVFSMKNVEESQEVMKQNQESENWKQ
ncbi:MAG: sugar transferase [Clostridia bacterium]|nr:sugar transferase [Clostridia bacterium]